MPKKVGLPSSLTMRTPRVAKGPPSPKGRVWTFEVLEDDMPREHFDNLQIVWTANKPIVNRVHWTRISRPEGEDEEPALYAAGILIFKDSQRKSMCDRILPDAKWTPFLSDKEKAKTYLQDMFDGKWEAFFTHYNGRATKKPKKLAGCTCKVPHRCPITAEKIDKDIIDSK